MRAWLAVRARQLSGWFAYLRSQEPARVQAMWASLVVALAGVGVTVTDLVDERVSGWITLFFLLVSWTQAKTTRDRVVPSDNVPAHYYSENVDRAP